MFGSKKREQRAAEARAITFHWDVMCLHTLKVHYDRDMAHRPRGLTAKQLEVRQHWIRAQMRVLRDRLDGEGWRASPKYATWRESEAFLKSRRIALPTLRELPDRSLEWTR